MKLYSSPISPAGKRVRILAHELGVSLDLHNVDFAKGEHRSPAYLALNPSWKVPTLVDGDLVLWESAAILVHIAQKSGGGDVWPKDLNGQSDALRWLFFGSCHLDPYYTTLVVERFIKGRRGEPADEAAAQQAEQWLARFLGIMDQQLASKEFLTGRFGVGDVALGCSVELSPVVRHDLAPFPHVRAWLDRLQARASWKAAAPGGAA